MTRVPRPTFVAKAVVVFGRGTLERDLRVVYRAAAAQHARQPVALNLLEVCDHFLDKDRQRVSKDQPHLGMQEEGSMF